MSLCLRPVRASDLDALFRLSAHLDSANLPHDRESLARRIDECELAFEEGPRSGETRRWLFVVDDGAGELAGCAMISAPLGTLEAPYVYCASEKVDAYSPQLQRRLVYPSLTLRWSREGPAELGALVVRPERRGQGIAAALTRFRLIWMTLHAPEMPTEVVAELAPHLREDGSSPLWDVLGAPLTGLSYKEADRLSKRDKRFIFDLFPRMPIPGVVLGAAATEVLGAAGSTTRGAQVLLEKEGFAFLPRIDPFDGGPHLGTELHRTQSYQLWTQRVQPTDSRYLRVYQDPGRRSYLEAELCAPPVLDAAADRQKHPSRSSNAHPQCTHFLGEIAY